MNYEYLKRTADNADIIFYLLYTGNKQFKSDDEMKIASRFAELAGAARFAVRSGIGTQNPRTLSGELKLFEDDIGKYDVILVDPDTGSLANLGYINKLSLIAELEDYQGTENSGQIAKRVLEESDEPVRRVTGSQ